MIWRQLDKLAKLGDIEELDSDYPINGLDNGEERGYRTKSNGRSTAEKVRQHER